MPVFRFLILIFTLIFLLPAYNGIAGSGSDEAPLKVWVFFKDKEATPEALRKAGEILTPEALKRRNKVMATTDWFDVPVNISYIDQLKPYILKQGHASRWLNAVAVYLNRKVIDSLRALPFVRDIRPVARRARPLPVTETIADTVSPVLHKTYSLDYGLSLNQLQMLNVPQLHDSGYSGAGVTIAMLDDGFSHYKKHEAFDRMHILDTWDFVNNNHDVDDPDAIENRGYHGSKTLSVVGGYAPGALIGPAYGAHYLLAKTEIDSIEVPAEEDNWVAGLEWAEAKGADIVSSSLGYIDWYTWEDMDGRTAVTTLATNVAEQKGVIVVNAAGNEGNNPDHNTLIAPADGVFVITAGGVTVEGNYWSVASAGPTVDGRIKPDVAAQASGTRVISVYSENGYTNNNGTSFATPLIAGVAALLLEAHPMATPEQIRQALRATASRADAPDRLIGYGIVNALEAARYLEDHGTATVASFRVSRNYPNPFRDYTTVEMDLPELSRIKIAIYNTLGQKVFSLPAREARGASPN
ncbi:MAG: hypothetical protein D6677_06010 [Calditrichaeota bacterium]|nr:MAG: hypothetical protein D6677_06010 [Calditrichota bacterium]